MNYDDGQPWDLASDEQLIANLILAIQTAIAATVRGDQHSNLHVMLPAPEVATALLNTLASVLEPAPPCSTPRGMRQVSEAAGKRILTLMRGLRERARLPEQNQVH